MYSPRRFFICLVFTALCCSVVCAAPNASTIEGGKGVGSYQLGKPFTPYQKALGEPTKVMTSEFSDKTRFFYYKKYGLYFFVKKDTVNGIQIESPLMATQEGVHVGSVRAEVVRVYGSPQPREYGIAYPERGLGFSFKDDRVLRILVFDKEERDLASGDYRIVPGVRVGGIQLGQSVTFVLKQWKEPQKKAPFRNKEGAELWSYEKKGVMVITFQGRVDGLWISSGAFHTVKDVHVGSKRDDVVRAYGNPKSKEENMETYPDNGLAFFYEKGVVKQIVVLDTRTKM